MFENNKFNINDLNREQKKYLHIGMKYLTNILKNSRVNIIYGNNYNVFKMLGRITIGSIINLNKTVFFSIGRPKYEVENYLIDKLDKKYWFDNLYIFDHIYDELEIYNLLLDIDRELNGIDLVIIDYKIYSEKLYKMLKDLFMSLNISFIVTYINEANNDKEFNSLALDKNIDYYIDAYEENKYTVYSAMNGVFEEELSVE